MAEIDTLRSTRFYSAITTPLIQDPDSEKYKRIVKGADTQ